MTTTNFDNIADSLHADMSAVRASLYAKIVDINKALDIDYPPTHTGNHFVDQWLHVVPSSDPRVIARKCLQAAIESIDDTLRELATRA